MRLELARCTVRPWAVADLDPLVKHANNRHVSVHLRDRFPFPYEREHGRKFLEWIARQAAPTSPYEEVTTPDSFFATINR